VENIYKNLKIDIKPSSVAEDLIECYYFHDDPVSDAIYAFILQCWLFQTEEGWTLRFEKANK
jgi:hypothetical protein